MRFVCRPVATDGQAEVLLVTLRRRRGSALKIEGTYARWYPTGRITRLGEPTGTTANGRPVTLALAGRYVVTDVEGEKCGRRCGPTFVRVNAKTGGRVQLEHVQRGSRGEFASLVLTTQGTAAWIETTRPCTFIPPGGSKNGGQAAGEFVCHGRSVAVAHRSSRAASEPTVLASSPTIDPQSLALAHGHLYWTEGGQSREAAIE